MERKISFKVYFENHAPIIYSLDEIFLGVPMQSMQNGVGYIKAKCEFTGRTDKNGKDIYEGDILNVRGMKRTGNYVTHVIYKGQGFKLFLNKTYLHDDSAINGACEIIGNIYENSELLNG